MIPDDEYIQLYTMFSDLLQKFSSADEKRIVYYQPELFIEMAKEILNLRRRISQMQHLHLDYMVKADECLRLYDVINNIRRECKEKHIKLDSKFDIRSCR